MTLYSYLKQSREAVGLTQAQAAEKMDVSIISIQNWEKDTIPDSDRWAQLIAVYQLDKEKFASLHMETVAPNENVETNEGIAVFPFMIFSDIEQAVLRKLQLTETEQDILGVLSCFDKIPYGLLKQYGVWHVRHIQKQLHEKLGNYKNIVVDFLTAYPNVKMDIFKLTVEQSFWFLNFLIKDLTSILKWVSFIGNISTPIFIKNKNSNSSYPECDFLENIDLKEMEDLLNIPSRSWGRYYHIKDISITTTYHPYIELVWDKDNRPEAISNWNKYQKSLALWEQNQDCMQKPIEPEMDEIGYLRLTEKGKILYDFCKKAGTI